jgi:hypothetical protein
MPLRCARSPIELAHDDALKRTAALDHARAEPHRAHLRDTSDDRRPRHTGMLEPFDGFHSVQ